MTKDQYLRAAEMQLDFVAWQLDGLERQAQHAEPAVRSPLTQALRRVHQLKRKTESSLWEVRAATGHAWQERRREAEQNWDQLASSLASVAQTSSQPNPAVGGEHGGAHQADRAH